MAGQVYISEKVLGVNDSRDGGIAQVKNSRLVVNANEQRITTVFSWAIIQAVTLGSAETPTTDSLDDDTTEVAIGYFAVDDKFNILTLYINYTADTGSPTSLQIAVDFSPDGSTTWFQGTGSSIASGVDTRTPLFASFPAADDQLTMMVRLNDGHYRIRAAEPGGGADGVLTITAIAGRE